MSANLVELAVRDMFIALGMVAVVVMAALFLFATLAMGVVWVIA